MTRSRFWKSDLATILMLSSVVFMFFFRAHWAFLPSWVSDEGYYLNSLSVFTGSSYGHEGFTYSEPYLHFAPGAPLLWIPAGLLGRLFAWFTQTEVVEWVLPWVGIYSFCLWAGSLVLLQKLVVQLDFHTRVGWKSSSLTSLAILLCVPALYYSTHRVYFAHSAELFLSIAVIYTIHLKKWFWAGVGTALLSITRFNDAPVMFLFLGAVYPYVSLRSKRILSIVGIASLLFWFWFAAFRGYHNETLMKIIQHISPSSISFFFLSGHSGTLWTAPWLLVVWVLGMFRWKNLSWAARGALVWITAECFLCAAWYGNGGDFGFRYLIGCYAAGFFLWMEMLGSERKDQWMNQLFRWLTVGNAIFITYLLITYKTIATTGPHNRVHGIFNPDFIFTAIQAPFLTPEVFHVAFFQQIPIVTLISSYFHPEHPLAVNGPSFQILAIFTMISLGYLICYYLMRKKQLRKKSR